MQAVQTVELRQREQLSGQRVQSLVLLLVVFKTRRRPGGQLRQSKAEVLQVVQGYEQTIQLPLLSR